MFIFLNICDDNWCTLCLICNINNIAFKQGYVWELVSLNVSPAKDNPYVKEGVKLREDETVYKRLHFLGLLGWEMKLNSPFTSCGPAVHSLLGLRHQWLEQWS